MRPDRAGHQLQSRVIIATAMAVTVLSCGASASAQIDLVSSDTVHGVLDLRAAEADGEPSFTNGGFGKARFGGDGGSGFTGRVQLATAALEWTPRLNWEWSAVIDVLAQPGQEHSLDIGQAYIVYKPVPRSATRFNVRAGLFYPAISMENDARAWGVTNTITPSAINSWVGEEVKVAGVEASATRAFGDQEFTATAAVFGFDDTAGTLLSFRGWALHDIQSQANGRFRLPPLSPFISQVQPDETYSTLDIDHHVGYYGRVEWRSAGPLTLNAFYYDNLGNMIGVTPDLEWAWATRFLDVGARWDVDAQTKVMAQALTGKTVMGFPTPGGRFANMDFRSAYLLATHLVGKSAFTARADLFDTHDNSAAFLGDTNERGWAITGAWRYPLTKFVDVRLEALHVDSSRPSRAYANEAAHQAQTVLQSSLRLSF
jgi:hypothetical protein